MNKVNFTVLGDLEKINANSLLFNADEEVASIQIGKYYFSLMCRGETRIHWKDNVYRYADDFPKEIEDYLLGKNDSLDNDETFCVVDNNWFQLEVLKELDIEDNIEKFEYVNRVNDYLDTCDIEGYLDSEEFTKATMLYILLISYIKEIKEHFKEELEDLDLSNV